MTGTNYTFMYNEYRQSLLAYATSLCSSKIAAEDIIQQVFLKLLENQGKHTSISNWKAYLFTLVRNEAISFLRRQGITKRALQAYRLKQTTYPDALYDLLTEKE